MRSRRNVQLNFQRRHFEFIANICSRYHEGQRKDLAEHFAYWLGNTNPQFDRDKFVHFAMNGEYPNETEQREKYIERAKKRAAREAEREAKAEANKAKAEGKAAVKYLNTVAS